MATAEDIKKAMQKLNFQELYQKLKQATDEFNANKTVETELAMRESEKNYKIADLRYRGYQNILETMDEIRKLEDEFDNLKRGR